MNSDTPRAAAGARHPLVGLLVAQFLGAFNDNAWKLVVALLALRPLAAAHQGQELEAAAQAGTAIAFAAFTGPLFLFSLAGGWLADRVAKRTIVIVLKLVEIVLLLLATFVVATMETGSSAPLVILGLLGVHSALFSPAKYGILPEILPHERLSIGNGLVELWTMIAILLGSALGPVLLEACGTRAWIAPLVLAALALAGFAAAFAIPRSNAASRPEPGGVLAAWSTIRADRVLWLACLGLALFWFIASALGQVLFTHARVGLGLPEQLAGLPLAALGAGVGLGALWAGRISGAKVEYGLVPLGALLLTFFTLLLAAVDPGPWFMGAFLLLMGVSSGFLVVPLNALLQWRAPADRRGAVLGLSNLLLYGGVLVGGLGAWFAAQAHWSSLQMIAAMGLVLLASTIWALVLVPDAFLRLVLVLLTHTLYRLRVTGRENVPATGGALLVPNHVTMVDGLWLMAALDRPVRFVMEQSYYERWWMKPFFRALGAIPIQSTSGPRGLLRALRDAGRYLEQDELVCIFAEGQLTRTGMMQPFRRGMERIAKGRGRPIVPIYLHGAWGSVFSHHGGRVVWKWPRRMPYPIGVTFGAPLPDDTPIHVVRSAVVDLGEAAWTARAAQRAPLHRTFVKVARGKFGALAVSDALRGDVSRGRLLVGAIALARALRTDWGGQTRVGILLPPSVAGVTANLSAALAGRTSVNLNYTAGRAGFESSARQAGLTTVLTSRTFLEKAKLELPDGLRTIFVEDVAASIGTAARLAAYSLARLAPTTVIERACGAARAARLDDIATIIFSSGSTGEPKGVPLTHKNIAANAAGVAQVIHVAPDDKLLSILPLFHSFGYLASWFALNGGLATVQHPNPLDPVAIGGLAESKRCTMLIATPTFLSIYLKRIQPGQFGSLRLVLAGAEKLSERLSVAFEETFGIRPIEGYGTTECSPVIAVSVTSVRKAGIHQAGAKRGSVGQPLPGIALRIVDPDTFAPRAQGESGLLLVKGANVMSGYLDKPELTAKVMREGWYVTGDLARQDEEGFLWITDRLSRFSKIGGEMVPHGKVEDALQEALGAALPAFAVTAVPDEKKGERLAVLHTCDAAKVPGLLSALVQQGLPNLFLPRADMFVKVDVLPMLGTGKLDLRRVKEIALEWASRAEPGGRT